MDICTIIAKNYVAQARVLARSFTEWHPGGRCFVLAIDEYEGYIDPSEEPFTILTPEQIGCAEFEQMALRYTVLELSTAVKPWLLAHLLREGAGAITYLDPDIRIYGSLERLDELARSHKVVLTPHNTVPLPDDGERPSQVDILLAGVYNLGYVSLGAGEEIDTLLRWWRERLLTDCRVDPLRGYFVDQRWFDLAPGLVSDRAIVRDPEYNAAYWNLHARHLEHDGRSYSVDGRPLAFFHFSGFDAAAPDVLSRHQTRIRIGAGSALERICREYAAEIEAAGYAQASEWPYTYGQLPSGIEYSCLLRTLFALGADRGELLESPFTSTGYEAFVAWLGTSEPDGPPGVNRALAEIYRTRSDLQAAFTDLAHDPAGLLQWARDGGGREEPVLGLLTADPDTDVRTPDVGTPTTGASEGPPTEPEPEPEPEREPATRAPEWGVNVVGYFRSELGTGEAARQVVSALDAVDVPLLPVHGRTIPPNRQGHAFTHLDHADARYPVNLICMNADVLGEFAAQAGPAFFDGRYSIGMWFWEVEQFPSEWHSSFEHVDELWLASDHIARAVGAGSPVPVVRVTLPVEMPPVLFATRAELGLPEGFLFLFSFDHHSVFERKNPLAVVEAFKTAFDADDGAVLVIKSINADTAPQDHARLVSAAEGRPDVHIIDGYVPADRKDLIVASCDCYVSLHRAEGFGLTMAEAMYLGKPVIATGYSGNLDFMSEDNSYLVKHELVAIGPDAAPYPADSRWADPDPEHAALQMRHVFDDRGEAAARARRGQQQIRTNHSADAAGRVMRERLDVIREQSAGRLLPITAPPALGEPLDQLVHVGPPPNAGSPFRRLRSAARRVVLRLIKPYSAHQENINRDLVRLLRALEAKVDDLDLSASERHALLLAELRAARAQSTLWERVAGLTRSTVELERVVGEEIPRRLDEGVGYVANAVRRIETEEHAIPYMEDSPFEEIAHPTAGIVQGYRVAAGATDSDVYRSFEDVFRGSEALIRERQLAFLPLLAERAPVLDFGCGRGEFLDLLEERGIAHLGVDSDAGMVERCHAKGHSEVVHADGLVYLDSLADHSLGAIFCAQVIEHLPFSALLELLSLSRAKLAGDGMLIAETVNPHCPSALKTFWVDPTHQHPVFPEVALQLARSAGFTSAFVFHPNGTGDVESDRFTQGEYALVAGGATLITASDAGDAARGAQARTASAA